MTELVREHDAGVKDGVAVVFVHGLEGDKRGSWINSRAANRDPWPQWLGQEAGCDTWTLGYDAGASVWRDFAGALHINGLSLMDKLATEPQLAGRPLILLAHDIGGLLVKKALVHAMTKAASRHRRMVGRIAALGLIATPRSGAQLNTIAQAIAIVRATAPGTRDFSTDDAHLQELQREFAQLGDGLHAKVHVYTEAKPVVIGRKWLGLLKTRAIAVPYDAHASHFAGEVVTTLAEDHFSICQPKDKSAPLHQSVVALIDATKTFSVTTSEAAVPQADAAQPSASAKQTQVEPVVVAVPQVPSPPPVAIEPAVEKPVAPPRQQAATKTITIRPALLAGAQDERLQANESKLYGRDRELTRVLTFLDNVNERAAAVLPRGVDIGGTGKTELCKAALKLWIQRDSLRKVFFIALPDDVDPTGFLHTFATGIGLDAADADTVFAATPPGLYFIDNLGGAMSNDQGTQLIERLKNLPDVRLLVSSRYVLSVDFAQNIEIDALPKQSALNLFRDLWSGSDVLPVDTALTQFVDGDLQRHAMSTALLARLGVFFAYDELQARWRALRAANPADHGLLTSMRLVGQALSTKTGALPMWRAVAQMPQGADAAQLLQAEADGHYPRGTAEFLQHHRILHKVGNRFVMPTAAIRIAPSLDVDAADA
jgi:hypothetical protein